MEVLFSKRFPWEHPTGFKNKILANKKIHILRKDEEDKYKPGMTISMVELDENNEKEYFLRTEIQAIQKVWIHPQQQLIFLAIAPEYANVNHAWTTLSPTDFALNDGFDTPDDLFLYFPEPVKLKVIHWTTFKY